MLRTLSPPARLLCVVFLFGCGAARSGGASSHVGTDGALEVLPDAPPGDAGDATDAPGPPGSCVRRCAGQYYIRGDGFLAGGLDVVRNRDDSPVAADAALDLGYGPSYQSDRPGLLCLVKKDGTVSCFGNNRLGGAGAGTFDDPVRHLRTVVKSTGEPLTAIRRVSVRPGGSGACALGDRGRVWCWGASAIGVAASADVPTGVDTPYAVPARKTPEGEVITDVTDLAAGTLMTCVVAAGTPQCWTVYTPELKPVALPDPVAGVACGLTLCCAVSAPTGNLWCWDRSLESARPMVDEDGLPVANVAVLEPGLGNVAALRKDGVLLSVSALTAPVRPVMPRGQPHTNPQLVGQNCYLDALGQLRTPHGPAFEPFCGAPQPSGRPSTCGFAGAPCCATEACSAGLGCSADKCTCGEATTPCCGGVSCNGRLSCNNATGHCSCITACSGAVALRADGAIIWQNGRLRGADGQIFPGHPSDIAASDADPASRLNGCVALKDMSAWCWGQNDAGQLGAGVADAASASPRQVVVAGAAGPEPLGGVTRVASGTSGRTFCAVAAGGQIFCWGAERNGLLGPGRAGPASVAQPVLMATAGPALGNAVDVTVGNESACALRADASVVCWGRHGPPQPIALSTAVSDVACSNGLPGGDACCARTLQADVWCWTGAGQPARASYVAGAAVTDVASIGALGTGIAILRRDRILYQLGEGLRFKPAGLLNYGLQGDGCVMTALQQQIHGPMGAATTVSCD